MRQQGTSDDTAGVYIGDVCRQTTKQIAPRPRLGERVEFTKAVKLAIFKRAGGPENLHCEKCRMPLHGKRFEYDHKIEEWERTSPRDEREPLTADDGWLLCIPCHDEKSGSKAGDRAHGKRIVEKAAKAWPKTRPLPGSRASGLRKRMNGNVERW